MRRPSIPLGDAPALRRARNRTHLVRVVLAAALVGATVAALVTARAPAARTVPFVTSGSSGIVVLDLSASVEKTTLKAAYRSLMRFAGSKKHYGLVLVSDEAYEALPPETPAATFAQVARFFTPITVAGEDAVYPANPWGGGFSFGTKISAGLELARSIILTHRKTVEPSVWLVSDLGDEPTDRELVVADAKEYAKNGIALHVVGLNPTKKDQQFFSSIAGYRGPISAVSPLPPTAGAKQRFPIGLAVAALVLAVLLAANELWSTPLRWGPTQNPTREASA